jgi:hypothetical protein
VKADFEPKGSGAVRVVLLPETALERSLLSVWLRNDEHPHLLFVDRDGDGHISQVAIEAQDAR